MHLHHPVRLDPVRDADTLREIRGQALWQEVDLLPAQLEELVDCRAVGDDTPEHRDAIRRALTDDRPLSSLGTWIHYPWSGRLVRVLPRDAFWELRLDRNRDKLTREEQARLRTARIAVVGLSVGNAVALTLAQEGVVGHLVLADFDELSTSNLNRIRAPIHDVGLPKTVVAARQIAEIDPFVEVTIYSDGLTQDNLDQVFEDVDIVVDECDDLAMKVQLRRAARVRRVPVLMETSDRGRLDVERYDQEDHVPLLNGRFAESLDPDAIRAMRAGERLALVAESVGYDITTRAAASMLEIDATLSTWPQLASDVALGGATVTVAVRRILLGRPLPSGLRVLDLDARLDEIEPAPLAPPAPAPLLERPLPPMSDVQRALIEAAVAAPSGGNVQPWAFRPRADGSIEVLHDATRSTSLLDADRTGGLLAVGAAIEGMALRASQLGHGLEWTATEAWEGVVATVRPVGHADPDPLADQLGQRFTDRRNPARVALSDDARADLLAGFDEPIRLRLLEDPAAIDEVAHHIGATDRLRFLHPVLQRELWHEIRWSDAEARTRPDGISIAELAAGPGDVPILKLLRRPDVAADLRSRDRGSRLGETALNWCRSASALALVTMRDDGASAWLRAGRALHRGWLAASAHGFGVQPLGVSLFLVRHLERPERAHYGDDEAEVLRAADAAYTRAFGRPTGERAVMLFRVLASDGRYAPTYRRPLAEVVLPEETPPTRAAEPHA